MLACAEQGCGPQRGPSAIVVGQIALEQTDCSRNVPPYELTFQEKSCQAAAASRRSTSGGAVRALHQSRTMSPRRSPPATFFARIGEEVVSLGVEQVDFRGEVLHALDFRSQL